MVVSVQTVSFQGVEARPVEVQVQISGGLLSSELNEKIDE